MLQGPAKPTSVDEFLASAHWQDCCYKFDDVQPIATIGGTTAHAAVALRLRRAIDDRLTQPLQIRRDDARGVGAGYVQYPPLVVTCSAIPGGTALIAEPPIVFEALSTSIDLIDRKVRPEEGSVPAAIGRCVTLAPSAVEPTDQSREGDARACGPLSGRDAIPQPMEFHVALRRAEVYRPIVLDN
jgi:hypothetical protein